MTTLFFNWQSVVTEAKSNPFKAVDLLLQLYNGRILKYGLLRKLKGSSFLLNPINILSEKNVDILYVYQYLSLASQRDYSLYHLYGIKSLPLSYYPDIRLDSIKTNPLLNVTKTDIIFKYEELTNGTKIRRH
jgi:hypothetical protein